MKFTEDMMPVKVAYLHNPTMILGIHQTESTLNDTKIPTLKMMLSGLGLVLHVQPKHLKKPIWQLIPAAAIKIVEFSDDEIDGPTPKTKLRSAAS